MFKTFIVALLLFQAQSVDKKAALKGLELSYPASITLQPIVSKEEVLVFTNFRGLYYHGGIIPPGGMEITVLVQNKGAKNMPQIISEDSQGMRLISTSVVTVGGQPGIRVIGIDGIGPDTRFQETRVYIEHGEWIYKFILTIYPDDPNRREFEAIFDRMLSSVRFK